MKRLLIGAALLASAIGAQAETKQALTLIMESGDRIVYYLDTQPEITFKGQNMVVTIDSDQNDYPMADVDRWEIGYAEYSDIPSVSTECNLSMLVDHNRLTIINPASEYIIVYSLNGQQVGAGNQPEITFDLTSGIYIVKTKTKSYKIYIK